jgi:hypothetical protein
MRKTLRSLACVLAVGIVGFSADQSLGALAKLTGGSGYSGTLSRNTAIRKHQLICDPADGSAAPGPLTQGAPRAGSTSVNYDPSVVGLSGFDLASGYKGSAFVEVRNGEETMLQDIVSFMTAPKGVETGYAQCFFQHGPSKLLNQALSGGAGQSGSLGILYRDLSNISDLAVVKGPSGEPGQTPIANGFDFSDHDGVKGFDTHQFFFTYRNTADDSDVAAYDIYADKGTRASGNNTDFLIAFNNGKETFLGPDQLSAAHVAGNLAVPLPQAVYGGGALLAIVGIMTTFNRRRSRSA